MHWTFIHFLTHKKQKFFFIFYVLFSGRGSQKITSDYRGEGGSKMPLKVLCNIWKFPYFIQRENLIPHRREKILLVVRNDRSRIHPIALSDGNTSIPCYNYQPHAKIVLNNILLELQVWVYWACRRWVVVCCHL